MKTDHDGIVDYKAGADGGLPDQRVLPDPVCLTGRDAAVESSHAGVSPRPPSPLRLHLGCGGRYLDDYVNIDVDDDGGRRRIDVALPLEALSYAENSVDEIRIEHVFEHFPRWMAELFLLEWFGWLKPGGLLLMAVPDFETTARAILEPQSEEQRCFKYRHIFGNHTTSFSFHRDGFSRDKLHWMLTRHGYEVQMLRTVVVDANTFRHRWDIQCIASKGSAPPPFDKRRAEMFRAIELYDELETVFPFIEQYLGKIAGLRDGESNFWFDRYARPTEGSCPDRG